MKEKESLLSFKMKYYIKIHFKSIIHWSCFGQQTEARAVCCLHFMGPCDLGRRLLQPVGRNLLEDAQQHKIMCLYWHAWPFGACETALCGQPCCWIAWEPRNKKDPPWFLSALCSFWSLCPGAVLGEGCRTGRSVREHRASGPAQCHGAGRMHKRGAMENGQCHCEATAIVPDGLQQSGEVSHHWKRTTMFQKEGEGETRELPAEQTLPSLREKVSGNSLCGFAKENVACQTSWPSIVTCLFQGMRWEQWANFHFNTHSRRSPMVSMYSDWMSGQPGEWQIGWIAGLQKEWSAAVAWILVIL